MINWILVDKLDMVLERKIMTNHPEMLCYSNGEYLIGTPHQKYGKWACESDESILMNITHIAELIKPNEEI